MTAPLDVLVLGSFVFTSFAVPENLPAGGRQQMRVHKLPGGDRVIDAMGPDDDDRQFSVLHVGSGALDDALAIDGMRIAGQSVAYSNGVEARVVVVSASPFKVERFNVVHQDITLVTVDNPAGDQGSSSSPDDLIDSDADAGQGVIDGNMASATSAPLPPERPAGIGINSNATPVTTPIGSGGIGSA